MDGENARKKSANGRDRPESRRKVPASWREEAVIRREDPGNQSEVTGIQREDPESQSQATENRRKTPASQRKPPESRTERPKRQKETGRKNPHRPGLLLSAVVLTALLTSAFFYRKNLHIPEPREGLAYEANIVQGDIPGKTKEERQKELDAIVEEGMLAMSINATPSGKTRGPSREINWLIENPSNQGKLIRVEIWRDDTNEKIYETGAIPPGNYVESAPLNQELPPGEYSCTARFYAYKEDETFLGQAAARIQLILTE